MTPSIPAPASLSHASQLGPINLGQGTSLFGLKPMSQTTVTHQTEHCGASAFRRGVDVVVTAS